MTITIGQVISWIIIGILAGSLVGRVLKRSNQGYGRWANWGIGLVGAILGGLLFSLLRIDFGLSSVAISLADLVQAFIGALIFVGILTFIRNRNKNKSEPRQVEG